MNFRMLTKKFHCYFCNKVFKKLVSFDENKIKCENCNGFAETIPVSEFNKEDLNHNISLVNNEINNSQYHLRTDVFDRNPDNLYGDARRIPNNSRRNYSHVNENYENTRFNENPFTQNQRNQRNDTRNHDGFLRDNFFSGETNFFYPFSMPRNMRRSPFSGSVNRHEVNEDVFHPEFFTFFDSHFNDVFMDNFASNFTSNFSDPMVRIIFISTMNNQSQGKAPCSKETIEKLKHFKMSEQYCKKDDKGGLEYPTCSICLTDMQKDEDSVLLPCGHLYHSPCVIKWLETSNSCPLCRYEFPNTSNQGQ